VRQAKLLAKNLVAVLRGESPKEYFHKNMGAVAGLGLYNGVFQSGKLALKGFVAWVAHRGYHGLAMPTWERKWRVLWGWWNNLWLGRDLVNLETVQNPRYVFEEFAARPRPAAPVDAAPAADKPAAAAKPAAEKAAAAKPATKKPAAKKAPAKKAAETPAEVAETAAVK
jgi:NADH dehydrogenase